MTATEQLIIALDEHTLNAKKIPAYQDFIAMLDNHHVTLKAFTEHLAAENGELYDNTGFFLDVQITDDIVDAYKAFQTAFNTTYDMTVHLTLSPSNQPIFELDPKQMFKMQYSLSLKGHNLLTDNLLYHIVNDASEDNTYKK